MSLGDADSAAREATAAVSAVERSSDCRGDRPGPGADLDQPAVGILAHHHAARIAGETLGRLRGNAGAVFEDGLARVIGVCEDLGIDVDHHLVPLAGGTGIDLVMQRGLGE
jgi:hypothetical protein